MNLNILLEKTILKTRAMIALVTLLLFGSNSWAQSDYEKRPASPPPANPPAYNPPKHTYDKYDKYAAGMYYGINGFSKAGLEVGYFYLHKPLQDGTFFLDAGIRYSTELSPFGEQLISIRAGGEYYGVQPIVGLGGFISNNTSLNEVNNNWTIGPSIIGDFLGILALRYNYQINLGKPNHAVPTHLFTLILRPKMVEVFSYCTSDHGGAR